MTIKEMAGLIGQRGLLRVENLMVPVEITDVKQNFGTVRVEIYPINGSGSQWVNFDRVSVENHEG